MSDKSTIVKETKDLLEEAQKEVVKTLNSETSFLSRLFSGSAKANLKIAQSSISKAINQIKNLREDESSIVGKLQKRISERDEKIKKLEENSAKSEKEASDYKDQVKVLEAKITDLQKAPEEKNQAETQEVSNNSPSLEEELRETISKLEDKTAFLTEKLSQNKTELKSSNDLVLEFSSRMKRLKSELTTK